jgi:hypothetical protein
MLKPVTCIAALLYARALAFAANEEALAAIRAGAGAAPVLEPGLPDSPKFQTLRLNHTVISHRGERYAMVRLKVPVAPRRPLVWMFADLDNIEEYELMPAAGGPSIRGNLRVIYPPLTCEQEEERPWQRGLALPRPWDAFPLHLLGVPAELLRPGEDYIVWFRFGDRRPTDVLLAATFLDPAVTLNSKMLPGVLGLPELLGE